MFDEGRIGHEHIHRDNHSKYDYTIQDQIFDVAAVYVKISPFRIICIFNDLCAENVHAVLPQAGIGQADPRVRELIQLLPERPALFVVCSDIVSNICQYRKYRHRAKPCETVIAKERDPELDHSDIQEHEYDRSQEWKRRIRHFVEPDFDGRKDREQEPGQFPALRQMPSSVFSVGIRVGIKSAENDIVEVDRRKGNIVVIEVFPLPSEFP